MEREEILTIYEAGPEAVINLINQLTARTAELKESVKLLNERLNKNSHNSSKPPSTDALCNYKTQAKKATLEQH
ncbi:MAG: hypothetical protein IBX40_10100 [Methanosarcinales archaeon]|nr:hypothetical protein [Methanosarcinales archaeon]